MCYGCLHFLPGISGEMGSPLRTQAFACVDVEWVEVYRDLPGKDISTSRISLLASGGACSPILGVEILMKIVLKKYLGCDHCQDDCLVPTLGMDSDFQCPAL
jgi:hypothetical protein